MPRVQRGLTKLGCDRVGQTLRMYFIPPINVFTRANLCSRDRVQAARQLHGNWQPDRRSCPTFTAIDNRYSSLSSVIGNSLMRFPVAL
jgi:hypothetical protein